ncbi:multidrug transporter [Sagittula sp. P11]|uniref:SapC family protein n=1 Tax=Sagittula sp. P11 TaxID=2009329 RepID=UPI000C2D01DB|nr:SapC family protein [Sagittula sp. P11]AUC55488.1 multidrug transporter [Sagittula sp. P11]
MTQLLFYENAVPVSSARHKKMSVRTGADYKFAEKVNSVPLTAIEFGQAAIEYPIVFTGNADTVMPCAILGATATKNLFVKPDGSWGGKYVPAFVRRYPFVFAQDAGGKQLILHIDESFEGCNEKDRGERLFDSDGNQTQYLKSVLTFLQDYQQRFNRTQLFCKRLMELDLLRPMEAQFSLPSGERQSLSGFQTVDREKLKAVSNEDLGKMMRTDELECIYLHLGSLRHFGSLAERFSLDGDMGEEPQIITTETVEEPTDENA